MCDNCHAVRVRDLCASESQGFTLSASTERSKDQKKATLLIIGTYETVGYFHFYEEEGVVTAFFEPTRVGLWAHFVACMLRTERFAKVEVGEAINELEAMLVEEAINAYPTLDDIPVVSMLEDEPTEEKENA